LAIKGIGFETADSILLYACGRPYFVIDSYTRRFAKSLGIKAKDDYESLREYFEKSLPKDVEIYREFHALIVEWGKSKPTDTIK
jgi:endonuclease-3 related protein